jgi:mannose-6-phosphate isomerase-like protein (cupin superfamily)
VGLSAMPGFDLETTYLALDGKGGVRQLPVGSDFWETIDRNEAVRDGTLVGVYPMKRDWDHWEMHPAGDEVLVLLEGVMTMILDGGGGERKIPMSAGTTLVVPAGTWHRALVAEPGHLLALTFGKGTQHRPS